MVLKRGTCQSPLAEGFLRGLSVHKCQLVFRVDYAQIKPTPDGENHIISLRRTTMKANTVPDVINEITGLCEDIERTFDQDEIIDSVMIDHIQCNQKKILEGINKIRDLFIGDTSDRFFSCKPFTQTQYFFMRDCGLNLGDAYSLGFSPLPDYDIYQMLYYEDDEQRCYINLKPQRPREIVHKDGSRTISIEYGTYPEELKAEYLRPEQREFFKQYMPETYKRFKTENSTHGHALSGSKK